jgi:hypothetical protein
MTSRVLAHGLAPVLAALCCVGAGGLVSVASAQAPPPCNPEYSACGRSATATECAHGDSTGRFGGGHVDKSRNPWRCVGGYWNGSQVVTPR